MGKLELENRNHDPEAHKLYQQLISDILPNELQAPLPADLTTMQNDARAQYLEYVQLVNGDGNLDPSFSNGDL